MFQHFPVIELLLPHHILLTTHYPLSNYSLLTTASPLSFNFHSRRLTIHYPQLTLLFSSTTTHYASPITCYARPITRYPLPITHWPLLTSPCSPFLHCSFTANISPPLRPPLAPKKNSLHSAPPRPPLPRRERQRQADQQWKFFLLLLLFCAI